MVATKGREEEDVRQRGRMNKGMWRMLELAGALDRISRRKWLRLRRGDVT